VRLLFQLAFLFFIRAHNLLLLTKHCLSVIIYQTFDIQRLKKSETLIVQMAGRNEFFRENRIRPTEKESDSGGFGAQHRV
jgi:hypothetical protein